MNKTSSPLLFNKYHVTKRQATSLANISLGLEKGRFAKIKYSFFCFVNQTTHLKVTPPISPHISALTCLNHRPQPFHRLDEWWRYAHLAQRLAHLLAQ